MSEITEVLRIVVDVVAERNAALRERDAARAELEHLRADLREAIELLRAFRRDRHTIADWEPIWYQADALLEKHKEKP